MSSGLIRVMEESVKNEREEKNDGKVTNMKISFSICLFSPTLPLVSRGWITFSLGAAVQCNVPYINTTMCRGYRA